MNKSVLVLEDEVVVAIDIAAELTDAGWTVIGPAGTLEEAEKLASTQNPRMALLDINLNGKKSFALAADLLEKGIKIVFLTGYSASALPEELCACTVISKPVDMPQLVAALDRIDLGTRDSSR